MLNLNTNSSRILDINLQAKLYGEPVSYTHLDVYKRQHFKHIGHTLFNDERYEGHQILRGVNLPKYKQFVKNVFEVLPRHCLLYTSRCV